MKNKKFTKDMVRLIHSIIFCVSLAAVFCLAFPALKIKGNSLNLEIDGLIAIFGGKKVINSDLNLYVNFNFNFLGLFAYKKDKNFMYYIVIVLFFVVAIFMLLEPTFFMAINKEIINNTFINSSYIILGGPIIGAICSLASSGLMLFIVLKK